MLGNSTLLRRARNRKKNRFIGSNLSGILKGEGEAKSPHANPNDAR
jgi:hypothetical protein